MIGSHNSLTYLPVRQWYLKPFKWMAKCQSKPILDQYSQYGVRLFDFRVRFDTGNPIIAHGPFEFESKKNCDVFEFLFWLDYITELSGDPVYVRLILESNKKMKDQDKQELCFQEFCEYCIHKYPHLTFFGGNRKYDWEVVYEFGTKDPELLDKYSSTTSIFGGKKENWTAKIDDFWPWLYAKLYNKKNYAKYHLSAGSYTLNDGFGVLFLDFVNIK